MGVKAAVDRPGFDLLPGGRCARHGKVVRRMGQRGRIKGPKQFLALWEEYKADCDSKTRVVYELNKKTGRYNKSTIVSPVTYTMAGFAVFLGMTKQNLTSTYSKNPKFEHVYARAKEECELDARTKFEQGYINPKLAGLWMAKYGYSTKQEEAVTGADGGPVVYTWKGTNREGNRDTV